MPRRASLAFILVTVFLDMLAIGIVVPVLPKLVLTFLDENTARAASIYGLFGTAFALMQFVFSPVQGALSDRFGRRPVILASNLGVGLDYILMAMSPTLGVLFLGRVISGATAASVSTAGAYIADVTPPDRRAEGFGMISIAFGIGFVLGPAIGGLLGGISPRLPFWFAAVLSLGNACYGWFVLPESLPSERRTKLVWQRANPLGALLLLRTERTLFGLACASFLTFLSRQVLSAVFVLYGIHRYGWDERDVGFTLAVVGIGAAVVGGGLVKPVTRWLGERRTLLCGLACGAAGFAVFGLAPNGALFWTGIPLMSLWGVCPPTIEALMSRRVPASHQGQLQGATHSLIGFSGLIGPLLFTQIFALSLTLDAGAPFLFAAVILLAALALAAQVTRDEARSEAARS
jgi:DHA1 family tetracycline resistance protein-like MFS transporter